VINHKQEQFFKQKLFRIRNKRMRQQQICVAKVPDACRCEQFFCAGKYMLRIGVFRLAAVAACAVPACLPAAADEDWTTRIYGRLVYDQTTLEGDRTGLEETSSEFRQALLGGVVKSDSWTFHANVLAASGLSPRIFDLWTEYRPGGGKWGIRAGQFKTPNSLDEQTSSLYSTTAERAAITDSFDLDRRFGIALTGTGERFTAMAGVFAGNISDNVRHEGHAAAARVTFVPWRNEDWTGHLGLSVRWREGGGDNPLLRYRQRPYAHQSGAILYTGSVFDSETLVMGEAAVLHGHSWAAAELAGADASLTAGGHAQLGGGNAEVGHVFGGHRTLNHGRFEETVIDRPVSEGGAGALTIAARMDTIDLSDGAVDGGQMTSEILAFTWSLNRNFQLRLDLFNADAGLGNMTGGLDPVFAAAVAAGIGNETVSGTTLRFQASF